MEKRSLNLDLIRAVAVFLVLSSHFLLRNGFYDELIAGKRMYVMVVMRYVFMSCVPIFLILTGYLNGDKKPVPKYFRKLGKTLILYVMASISCLLFSHFCLHETMTVREGILKILNYTGSDYAWYIEMYIGLFLMTPFLNLMFNGLETKRQRDILLFVLIFITGAASVFNVVDLTQNGFVEIHTSGTYSKIVPSFWTDLYPILYYMVGMYIRTYGFPLKPKKTMLAIVLATAVFSTYNYIRKYQQPFNFFSPWLGRSSIQNLLISVLIFGFLLNLRLSRVPGWIAAVIRKISQLSFLTFLLSSASDSFLYPYLWYYVPQMTDRLNYYIPTVVCSFLMAMLGAQVLLWMYQGGSYAVGRIAHKIKGHDAV